MIIIVIIVDEKKADSAEIEKAVSGAIRGAKFELADPLTTMGGPGGKSSRGFSMHARMLRRRFVSAIFGGIRPTGRKTRLTVRPHDTRAGLPDRKSGFPSRPT